MKHIPAAHVLRINRNNPLTTLPLSSKLLGFCFEKKMKASIKFRNEQNLLIRAKLPLSILGFPFQSGIVAGESKELSLNLSTLFDSAPSLTLSYRPNDLFNPLGLVFKSGIGHLGSPIASSLTISAEFNIIGNQNPRFFVHFKPQLGDFTLKKSQSSDFVKSLKSNGDGIGSGEEKTVQVVECRAVVNNGYSVDYGLFHKKKFAVLSPELPAASVVKGFFSGIELSARTTLPLSNRAVLNFRWGVRLPAEEEAAAAGSLLMKSNETAGVSLKKFPLLVMNKVGIEHVAEVDKKDTNQLEEACLDVKRQLEVIQLENGMLRKAMDDLRSEIVGDRREMKHFSIGKIQSGSNGDKKSSESKGFDDKKSEGNVR